MEPPAQVPEPPVEQLLHAAVPLPPLWEELRHDVCRSSVRRVADRLRGWSGELAPLVDGALREAGVLPAAWLLLAAIVAGLPPPVPVARRVLLQLPEDDEDLGAVLAWGCADRSALLLDLVESNAFMWGQTGLYLWMATEDLQGEAPPRRLLAMLRRWSRDIDRPYMRLGIALAAIEDPWARQVGAAHLPEGKTEKATREIHRLRRLLKAPPLDVAPERTEQRSVGFTVRRAPRVGRNDPCPCGSGRKYKRCCEGADQVRAADPAPVPGLTLPEYRARISEFVPLEAFEKMTPDELLPLPLEPMPAALLKVVAERYLLFERWEPVERILALLSAMPGEEAAAQELRRRLVYDCYPVRAAEVMRRQLAYPLDDETREFAEMALALLTDGSPALALLERMIDEGLRSPREEALLLVPYLVQVSYPALGLVVGRSALNILFPKQSAREIVQLEAARDRLCLPPGDRFCRIFQVYAETELTTISEQLGERAWHKERDGMKAALAARDEEIAEGRRRVEELERALGAVQAARDEAQGALRAAEAQAREEQAEEQEQEHERRRLLGKIERLKALVAEGVEERTALRQRLAEAETRAAEHGAAPAPPVAAPEARRDADDVGERWESDGYDGWRVVLLPLWAKAAQQALRELPTHISREALVTVGQLAAGEPGAWRGAKRLKEVNPPLYEVRVGLRYRGMFRVVDDTLEVLEIIHRRQLDLRLKHLYA